MQKRTKAALIVLALLALPLAYAVSTTTTVYYTISTLVAYTLTLPGQSAVTANSSGAPTPDIQFSSPTGTDTDVNPCVYSTAYCQNSSTPIFQFDNTGTVNLNLSVVLSSGAPSCINHTGATSYGGAGSGVQIGNANVTVVNSYTPAAAAQDWYMKADFSGCTAGDSTTRTLTSYGVQS
jgi:hypothetical protein